MAIYNNREVSVIGPNPMANTPETINIRYKDGTHENVAVSRVHFTADEKAKLVKNHPSKYEHVPEATAEDLEAVRTGVAPPSDPAIKEAAHRKAQQDKQTALAKKNADTAKAQADKEVSTQSKVTPATATTPATVTPVPVTPVDTYTPHSYKVPTSQVTP